MVEECVCGGTCAATVRGFYAPSAMGRAYAESMKFRLEVPVVSAWEP